MNAQKELTVVIYNTELARNCQKISGAKDDVAYLKHADDNSQLKKRLIYFVDHFWIKYWEY